VSPGDWAIVLTIDWLAWAGVCAWVHRNPRGDFPTGVLHRAAQVYALAWHRLRVAGRSELPATRDPGPLIVVANHASGVDPILIQAACPFEIRWMMGADMMHPGLAGLWGFMRIIGVDRDKGDSRALREALRHVHGGGVLGVFPEGRIERPPRKLLPFEPGVGLLIAKSGAPVLAAVVEGVPDAPTAWQSLLVRSRATVTFRRAPTQAGKPDPRAIVADLEARFAQWTGWDRAG
jgi:1-acyl-sn-glycerol-3-phosphate acyltransferase